jgi:thioredoxin-dependent peroxiredoxin
MLSPGTPAPDFDLPCGGGRNAHLADYRGKHTVVVYFYPKDDTPGCTVESCSFRDSHEDFLAAGAVVIGISKDSVESHDRFSGKHKLPFLLASDRDGKVAEAYQVGSSFLGLLPGRVTYVIDRQGMIRDAFSSQLRVKTHVGRALDLVRSLEAK